MEKYLRGMTDEELLDRLVKWWATPDGIGCRIELLRRLSRLEELEKENKEIKLKCVCVYCGKVTIAKSQEDKLDAIIEHMANCEKHPLPKALVAVEDMACCGNCKHHYSITCPNAGNKEKRFPYYAELYCPSHTPDGLTREEREK